MTALQTTAEAASVTALPTATRWGKEAAGSPYRVAHGFGASTNPVLPVIVAIRMSSIYICYTRGMACALCDDELNSDSKSPRALINASNDSLLAVSF